MKFIIGDRVNITWKDDVPTRVDATPYSVRLHSNGDYIVTKLHDDGRIDVKPYEFGRRCTAPGFEEQASKFPRTYRQS